MEKSKTKQGIKLTTSSWQMENFRQLIRRRHPKSLTDKTL